MRVSTDYMYVSTYTRTHGRTYVPSRCSSNVSRSLSMSARAFAQSQIVFIDLITNRKGKGKGK